MTWQQNAVACDQFPAMELQMNRLTRNQNQVSVETTCLSFWYDYGISKYQTFHKSRQERHNGHERLRFEYCKELVKSIRRFLSCLHFQKFVWCGIGSSDTILNKMFKTSMESSPIRYYITIKNEMLKKLQCWTSGSKCGQSDSMQFGLNIQRMAMVPLIL